MAKQYQQNKNQPNIDTEWTCADCTAEEQAKAILVGYKKNNLESQTLLERNFCPNCKKSYQSLIESLRNPDYYSANISVGGIVGWNGNIVIDRYGQVYYSVLGLTIGKSTLAVAGSVTANWLWQSKIPTAHQLQNFLTGHGYNIGGGYYLGGGMSSSPGNGKAFGVGLYTPQIGGSYNYTHGTYNLKTNKR